MSTKLTQKLNKLVDKPGVYFFKDKQGNIIYIGKASSLKRRVKSYFMRAGDIKTEKLVSEIFDLEIEETPSAIEALILEAELIKKYKPKYNIREKDDKSFIYIGITREDYPKPILIRGHELKAFRQTQRISIFFGPFTSTGSLREALKILRGIFPWSECKPNQNRPCFYYGIKKCPGVCVGKISKMDYKKNIDNLKLFLKGERKALLKKLAQDMKKASKRQEFELAGELRNKIYALNHIRDISLIKNNNNWSPGNQQYNCSPGNQQYEEMKYNAMGRIEGYDISNISGTNAVGSMVVCNMGEMDKSEYKKFKIKNFNTPNDIGMMREVLTRRFNNDWQKPDIIFIDGGRGQVNVAEEVLRKFKLKIPVIGIAKGITRKNDEFIYDKKDLELKRVVEIFPEIFKKVRDEAHRFAITYHKKLRSGFLTKKL